MTFDSPRPAGFTLVEVMIALVVLSVGLLGIAMLQLEILRASRGALLHAQAVALAGDMAERIRVGRQPDGAYDCGGPCGPGAGRSASATAEIAAWRSTVVGTLPEGIAEITHEPRTGSAPGAYTIRLHWTDRSMVASLAFQLRLEQ